MLEHGGVSLISGSAFGVDECVRISYAASEVLLLKACDRHEKYPCTFKIVFMIFPQLTPEDIEVIFSDLQNKNVLIIGDVMVDAYWWGSVSRISPEAPVPVSVIK